MKYNTVLRSKSKDAYLVQQAKELTLGNDYVTTIHAINSCVIKLSKLTKAGKVWRGIKDAKLPKSFWVANSMGVRGGIECASAHRASRMAIPRTHGHTSSPAEGSECCARAASPRTAPADDTALADGTAPADDAALAARRYGFSSTSTDKHQALMYAGGGSEERQDGDACTVFEMQMGMVDRGANLTWLSQYPHESEVLLPPLTGLEALDHSVEGGVLVIQSRLSLNMAAHTLEQVLSRRRKMLMDMCSGIELEVRDALDERLGNLGVKMLNMALQFGPLSHPTEWFNDDDNFASVMSSTLRLQHVLMSDIAKLAAHMEKAELSLRGWRERADSRMFIVAGWVNCRTSQSEVAVDVRDARVGDEEVSALGRPTSAALPAYLPPCPPTYRPALRASCLPAAHPRRLHRASSWPRSCKSARGSPRSICAATPASASGASRRSVTRCATRSLATRARSAASPRSTPASTCHGTSTRRRPSTCN